MHTTSVIESVVNPRAYCLSLKLNRVRIHYRKTLVRRNISFQFCSSNTHLTDYFCSLQLHPSVFCRVFNPDDGLRNLSFYIFTSPVITWPAGLFFMHLFLMILLWFRFDNVSCFIGCSPTNYTIAFPYHHCHKNCSDEYCENSLRLLVSYVRASL